MPGYTQYYGLAFFDFGDKLDSVINARLEVDRFVTIDRQLYGLYNVFGNGVISGLEVYDNGYTLQGGISIGVTTGLAIIKYMCVETSVPVIVNSLVPNSVIYIYANTTSSSTVNRSVSIVVSFSENIGSNQLLLATVVTGDNSIVSIDNTVRTYIEYEQSLLDEVNNHKHRGSPTKIDLERETKNQLPGARIEGFDTSKLETGRLSSERIPVLDHSSLTNAGNIPHAGLDAIVDYISDETLGLLGEVASVNLMRQIIFLRYKFDDVDKYMVNEFCVLPGVTPGKYVDYDSSSAWIAEDIEWCIIGYPVTTRDTYFFTQNFELPSPVKKVILTSHKSVPDNSEIVFGINTFNSVDWATYTEISDGHISDVPNFGNNLRVGIKFVWNGDLPPIFSEDAMDFFDYINLYFTNTGAKQAFHYRMRFYKDYDGSNLTNLLFTADSRFDQERWYVSDTSFTTTESLPCAGYVVDNGQEVVVSYYPDLSRFLYHKTYYVVIDVWDGDSFEFESDPATFGISIGSNIGPCELYDYLPLVKNFAVMFELISGEQVTLNI